jgi:hypothetical protein
MRVAISGSRTFEDFELVERVLRRLLEQGHQINVGDASRGVDRFVAEIFAGAEWTEAYPAPKVYEARWDVEGRAAGHNRNAWMVSESDMLIALLAPGPPTPGTSNAILQAWTRRIPVHTYHEGVWS